MSYMWNFLSLFNVFPKFYCFFQLFFILNKKNSNISTLHVVHHSCMCISMYFGIRYTPGMTIILLLVKCAKFFSHLKLEGLK